MEKPFSAYRGDRRYVFVCYAHEDADVVYPELLQLHEHGVNVWYDEGISAGKNWRAAIGDSLLGADRVLFYISGRSLQSDHCNREINLAIDEGKDVVPVYLEHVELTSDLKVGLNRVQALNRNQDTRYQQHLLEALGQPTSTMEQPSSSLFSKQHRGDERTSEGTSIAVLPFVNISSDPEQEYFADGITEDLIDRLSRHSSLSVIARTSAFYFKNRAVDVREIGARLGVTRLVEGSVRRFGNKIRVTAQLVRTVDGAHEWSHRYDHELNDVFALQDEITNDVNRQLTNLLVEPTSSYQPIPGAYEEYLRGQAWLRRSSFEAAQRARSFFDRAFEMDPRYSEACAAAARALLMERYYSSDNLLKPLELAAEYVSKALALDPILVSALVHKARVLAELDFDIQASLDLLRDVLNREPDTYEALSAAIRIYEFAGRSDLAELAARELIRIDPVNDEGNSWLFFLLLQQGRLDEAQAVGESLLLLEPTNRTGQAYANMAWLMAAQGRLEESLAFIDEHGLQTSSQACLVFAQAGCRGEVEKAAADMEPRPGRKVELAHCYALLGDSNTLLRALDEAIDSHDPLLFHLAPKGPYHESVNVDGIKLETIYNEPGVQRVLRKANLDRESIRRLNV